MRITFSKSSLSEPQKLNTGLWDFVQTRGERIHEAGNINIGINILFTTKQHSAFHKRAEILMFVKSEEPILCYVIEKEDLLINIASRFYSR